MFYFSEEEIADALEALIDLGADLQKRNVAHRNLKPQNVVVNGESSLRDLRLINFELGYTMSADRRQEEHDALQKLWSDILQDTGSSLWQRNAQLAGLVSPPAARKRGSILSTDG